MALLAPEALRVMLALRGTPATKAHPATRGTPATTALLVRGVQPEMLVVLATPETKAALAIPVTMVLRGVLERLAARAVMEELEASRRLTPTPETPEPMERRPETLVATAAMEAFPALASPLALEVRAAPVWPVDRVDRAALVPLETRVRLAMPEQVRLRGARAALRPPHGRGVRALLALRGTPEHPAIPVLARPPETRAVPLPLHGRV